MGLGLTWAVTSKPRPEPTPRPTASILAAPTLTASAPLPTPSASSCLPSDQDQYVYNPQRLKVLQPCIHVTGTIAAIRTEADGDYHVLLALDPQYASLLTAANANELGDLVVEPVCEHGVTQADAVAICATDHDPVKLGFVVGEHVWMEGRYVLDLDHGGWAEIHALSAWGPA